MPTFQSRTVSLAILSIVKLLDRFGYYGVFAGGIWLFVFAVRSDLMYSNSIMPFFNKKA